MNDFEKYVQRYLNLISSDNWIEEFTECGKKTVEIFSDISEEQSLFAYDTGKWNLKELLLHLSDTERVFQYRILAIARGDQNELPGFDENSYANNSFANERSLQSLIEEYKLIRNSSEILLKSARSSALQNVGNANGNRISAETIGKLIVGHNIHHLNIISERYLPLL
ncbi:DinB family protein [Chryseobacterium oryzae]|uniref:DinB family protein n=1 Tax=Chryseobacterium oryzae TaxID=2929799 RepID=A0ABY4BE73_9FLAO|nr:DinB family protein [Chryseobacterium oryzae]UOE37194.1 DinB family protein [Chryseobacterium oryzae]